MAAKGRRRRAGQRPLRKGGEGEGNRVAREEEKEGMAVPRLNSVPKVSCGPSDNGTCLVCAESRDPDLF